jgi:hypothetical protein
MNGRMERKYVVDYNPYTAGYDDDDSPNAGTGLVALCVGVVWGFLMGAGITVFFLKVVLR